MLFLVFVIFFVAFILLSSFHCFSVQHYAAALAVEIECYFVSSFDQIATLEALEMPLGQGLYTLCR